MAETSQTFDLRADLTAGEVKSWMNSVPTHATIKVETGIVGHYTNERVEPVRIRATWAQRVISAPLNSSDAEAHLVNDHGVHPVLAQLAEPAKVFSVHDDLHTPAGQPKANHTHRLPFPPTPGTESVQQ